MAAAAVIPQEQSHPKGRVIFTQGGKGGVGKTAFTTLLVEWFAHKQLPHTLLDLDFENKSRGSLAHYFPDIQKVNVNTPRGLDAFVDVLEKGAPIVIADMGASSGEITAKWFDSMYEGVHELGVAFTAIGLLTPDPASVESVLRWGAILQRRADYLIVKNAITDPADFSYWEESKQAQQFRQTFHPGEIEMEYRLPSVENPARQHGLTLVKVADRQTDVADLQSLTVVIRAQAYKRHLFAELDRVKDYLLL